MRMTASEFYTSGIDRIYGNSETNISTIVYDSRKAVKDSAFFCLTGENHDGHRFIEEAIQNGASVIIGSDINTLKQFYLTNPACTFLASADPRQVMGRLAVVQSGYVHKKLKTIAVTGTNGKTTVTAFVRSLLNQARISTGSIGTAGIWDHKQKLEIEQSTNTTPEAPDLHAIFRQFADSGLEAAALEVTSIGIEQQRVVGTVFDIGVHTNLTPEHLEFHKTFTRYRNAKLKLFDQVKKAVINADDDGMRDAILDRFDGPYLTYGIRKPADVTASHLRPGSRGTSFRLSIGTATYDVFVPVHGNYNVSNVLAAVCVLLHLGLSNRKIVGALTGIQGPEGRFEIIDHPAGYKIIMDYAHTPDGLEKVLDAAHRFEYRRLILMISGIGLRSPEKRPQMAALAEQQADEIIVTVDHPGFFSREQILDDVFSGFRHPRASNLHREPYRKNAIHKAMALAGPGDLVLLTGLGFGGYQVIGDERVSYNERESIESFAGHP
ncbi:UDP-N-acetylmuramoyl-L-alanyl-D-glutamate--2,6-diaminopimelate ligase [Planococcus lenghuensis]|uniref:UDP-N-acetylmuramyl-tripeptide synthetase n=1 Tax=Planococcus lenghuensis TaxID=2213202 RepID=A0A1Q2KW02_9BACL|nr:UDP-N-acetylmuramoyl-L-alanyl-D-glutamate--2,6-diaminopimelate ligase [Planococcus lenghuensis]AQQ52296.1 UDP-N-acetylmuramoyl-L-alanyl-D-glutamate--2,6-diaminopimelate ligase [Planococcus lenghuensis]